MKKIYLDDLKPGQVVQAGYRTHRWLSEFVGFVLDERGLPRAKFQDFEDAQEWEAYLFNGRFCVGSSADPLLLFAA